MRAVRRSRTPTTPRTDGSACRPDTKGSPDVPRRRRRQLPSCARACSSPCCGRRRPATTRRPCRRPRPRRLRTRTRATSWWHRRTTMMPPAPRTLRSRRSSGHSRRRADVGRRGPRCGDPPPGRDVHHDGAAAPVRGGCGARRSRRGVPGVPGRGARPQWRHAGHGLVAGAGRGRPARGGRRTPGWRPASCSSTAAA